MDNRGRTLCLITVLVCLLDGTASWGQTDNPTASDPTTQQTAGVTKKLPTCQEQLAACKDTLKSTQRKLARCTTNFNTCTSDLENCQTDLDACEAEPRVVFPGDGWPTTPEEKAVGIDHGARLSYTDHGDGTITDNNTRLMWEKKEFGEGIHHAGNTYQWTINPSYPPEPNGSLFTVFLPTLNTAPCFAGYCDWRIPNIRELASIVNHAGELPATSLPGLRNTTPANYWSSTTFGIEYAGYTWIVRFENGLTYYDGKTQNNHAIAVRSGQ